ncbi:MAG: hypothetical protein KDC38_12485, partial [Planctomycetes bacterium]|nr:hypothetical protein [Planctomycetota bacterium]
RRLTGYHGIEIRTRFAKGILHWDTALSAGRPVWGFAGDDCHDPTGIEVGAGTVLVNASERTPAALLDALRRGRFVNSWARYTSGSNRIEELSIQDGVIHIRLMRVADMLRFIGQDGVIVQWHSRVGEASYTVRPQDTYVRIELNTRGTFMYTNPMFRHSKGTDVMAAHLAPPPAERWTLFLRMFGILGAVGSLTIGLGGRSRWRRLGRDRSKRGALQPEERDPTGAVRNTT